MDRDIAKRWVKALRSGLYPKTAEFLRNPNGPNGCGFCALGVLCDLYYRDTGDGWPAGHDPHLPAPAVLDWAGIKYRIRVLSRGEAALDSVPRLTHNGEQREITDLNDIAELSFAQLADLIDDQWENL